MADIAYYRPEWTCGRYNKEAKVAIYYNLIEGMSYFFENDSAEIVGKLLTIPRNECLSVDVLTAETNTAQESLLPFLEELAACGLLTTSPINKDWIMSYRKAVAAYKCSQSQAQIKSTKEKLPMAVSSAEMDYMTLKEASEKWGISVRQINYYCAGGRIPGAVKMATIWLIPKDAEKPVDMRKKQGRQRNENFYHRG